MMQERGWRVHVALGLGFVGFVEQFGEAVFKK